MAIKEIIRTILGITGNVTALGLFLSPVPTFYKIYKSKSTKDFSPVPYATTLLNCLLWAFYGLPIVHPNSILVLTINSLGAIMESTYTFIFFAYASKKGKMKVIKMLGAMLSFFFLVVMLTLLLAHTTNARTLIVGAICVVIGTIMYASPLTIIRTVIRTKSVEYMPFNISLMCLLNGLVWTAYAAIKFDVFITVPNVLGSILAGVQLVIYALYFKNQNTNVEAKNLPSSYGFNPSPCSRNGEAPQTKIDVISSLV